MPTGEDESNGRESGSASVACGPREREAIEESDAIVGEATGLAERALMADPAGKLRIGGVAPRNVGVTARRAEAIERLVVCAPHELATAGGVPDAREDLRSRSLDGRGEADLIQSAATVGSKGAVTHPESLAGDPAGEPGMLLPVLGNVAGAVSFAVLLQRGEEAVPGAIPRPGPARFERPIDAALLEALQPVVAEGSGAFLKPLADDPSGEFRTLRPSFGDVAVPMLPQEGVKLIAVSVPVGIPIAPAELSGGPLHSGGVEAARAFGGKSSVLKMPTLIDDPEGESRVLGPAARHVPVSKALMELDQLAEPALPAGVDGRRRKPVVPE
jgi:hypothetical protein